MALSSNAIPSTPTFPVSNVKATSSSTLKESSNVLARVFCINIFTSSSSYPSSFACFKYADIPFNPYIINSLKLLMSSSFVASTPTTLDFSSNSSLVLPLYNAAFDKFSLFLSSFNSFSFILNVSNTLL
ncbi:hypothetical protein CNEONATNEC26_02440 [Clostridium neonatale]|nr:hypothetical protein CNEONATNEC32_02459 [Clostridium neonatale]SUQ51076.1 hypothetical protein CNEONATNEC26_02440 [Clostridium neonatale]